MGEVSFLDVSKRFTLRVDGEVHHVQALDRVSFTVKDGEIVALIGPSGCGKTTALRVAMGLDPSNGGRVTVDGREINGCGHDRGMVFQHAELLPWLSALQNVMFGLEMKGIRGTQLRDTAERYLQLVGLKPLSERGDAEFAVLYRGPLDRVVDERGQMFVRGQRTPVDEATWRLLRRGPFAEHFTCFTHVSRQMAAHAAE